MTRPGIISVNVPGPQGATGPAGPTGATGPAGPTGAAGTAAAGNIITPRGGTLTIASGVITVSDGFHYVDTEAAAATDDLDTINGGTDGQRLVLCIANASRTVRLRNGQGNISCGVGGSGTSSNCSGFTLDAVTSNITLIYDATQAQWLEQGRHSVFAYPFKNVKDYGAVGDGITDDRAAINRACNDNAGNHSGIPGTVYFPAGTYLVSSPGVAVPANSSISLVGETGATITGNFNGFLVNFTGGFNYGNHSIENMFLVNSNTTAATSGCIFVDGVISLLVKCCRGGTGGGVWCLQQSAQDVTLLNCTVTGSGAGVGFHGANACAVIECDFVGLDKAITHENIGMNVIGGRFEINNLGIQTSVTVTGGNASSSNVNISGCSMESNKIHMKISGGVTITGVGGSSFTAGCTNGLWIQAGNVTCMAVGFSGGYTDCAIRVDADANTGAANVRMMDVSGANSGGTAWIISDSVDTTGWINTDYTPAITNRFNLHDSYNFPPVYPIIDTVTATIASGVVTVAGNYMTIDTEGAAASDNLDTISGLVQGQTGSRLVLRAANDARTVVVKNGTGNIFLAGSDFTMDNSKDIIQLIWDGNPTRELFPTGRWLEISRSDNGA